jgi:benzoate membrane transport protein
MRFLKDLSPPAFTAGFVAVLVGFTSSVAIVFQAALAFGATPEIISSWMWALGLGMGLCTAIPSLILRMPVMIAWSTPGAAVLAVAGAGYGLGHAVGAFMLCAAAIALAGMTGWFERVMNRIPMAIASALLAGVLARFGLEAFLAAKTALGLVLLMLAVYLLGRRLLPRYAVPLTLLAAIAYSALRGELAWSGVQFALAMPVFVMPQFSWQAAISLAVPLFVVTMASQNLPGVAAIRASGYGRMPISPLITMSGIATLVLAPFGAFALNLSAITAAICMGREAHEDPARRYTASVAAGLFYVVVGLAGGAVAMLLTAFPRELVMAIAGLALLGTIAGALASALKDEAHRDAAIVTFLVCLSGISFFGIGAAFWGVVAGGIATVVAGWRRRP